MALAIVATVATPAVAVGALLVYLAPLVRRPEPPPAAQIGYRYEWPAWRAAHQPQHVRGRPPNGPVRQLPLPQVRIRRLAEVSTVYRWLAPDWRAQLAWRPA